jgi:hypothetical protein
MLVTSRPELLPLPRLSDALGERPLAESVTPISTPVDFDLEDEVSISCADLNMIAPGAERVKQNPQKAQEVHTESVVLFSLFLEQNPSSANSPTEAGASHKSVHIGQQKVEGAKQPAPPRQRRRPIKGAKPTIAGFSILAAGAASAG